MNWSRLKTSLFYICAFAVAGCSGGSGTSGVPAAGTAPTTNGNASGSVSAQSTFTVTGTVQDIYSAQKFLIQGGSTCGLLVVNITSTTKIITDGQPIAVGRYAESIGSGSCATSATAVTLYVAGTAAGLQQLVAASSTSTPAPTAPPATGTSASAYSNIVNGQPMPASFSPFTESPVWHAQFPASPAHILSSYDGAVNGYLPGSNTGWYTLATAAAGGDDFYPLYLAASTDPQVTIQCSSVASACSSDATTAGGSPTNSNTGSVVFRIPANAADSGGSDHNLAVIQPNGTEVDLYGCNASGPPWTNGQTITGCYGVSTYSVGSTMGLNTGTTNNGDAFAAGVIHYEELVNNLVPHAIVTVANCTTGGIYPSPGSGNGGTGCIPTGSRLWLDLTPAQIAALPSSAVPVPALEDAVLVAMHNYGMYIFDQGGFGCQGSTPCSWSMPFAEDPRPAFVNSQPNQLYNLWVAHGATPTTGVASIPGINFGDSHFTGHIHVLDRCYAAGSCSDSIPPQ